MLTVVIAACMLVSCVSAKIEGVNNPTLPGPQWRLYGGVEIGYAITLPRAWSAFGLNTQLDLGSRICALDSHLAEARRQQMTALHDRGVRLFACDTSRDSDPRIPVAYAVTGPAPPGGVDKYLDESKQVQGREVVDRRRHGGAESPRARHGSGWESRRHHPIPVPRDPLRRAPRVLRGVPH